ncbi:MAG: PaaI family thioesterase [Zoogloeaceae bacterium]|jgi:acyl-coenzyme A thioesterase PaaI-like protein|nr:PaaI family thioesterase [Zoogloeaceae bacterium]
MQAFQDDYPDRFSHCFGCGKSNPQGLRLKTYWDDEDAESTLTRFTPPAFYSGGVPENVYGGLIAALFDCHGTASAAAFACRAEGRGMGEGIETEQPAIRYVTASLKVDFLRPTPQHQELAIRARLVSLEGRKVKLDMTLSAGGKVCAKGEMLAVRFVERQETEGG